MPDFVMPSLGADMEWGTLACWHVKPGDRVRRGQIIAEVQTDKGVIEVESFHDGVIEEFLVAEEAQVPVGTVLARIREVAGVVAPGGVATGAAAADEWATKPPVASAGATPVVARESGGAAPAATAAAADEWATKPPVASAGATPAIARDAGEAAPGATAAAADEWATKPPVASAGATPAVARDAAGAAPRPGRAPTYPRSPHRRRISPFARRLAADLGVDVTSIHGTGPAGAVLAADVRDGVPGHHERRASPSARRLAREQGVELSEVAGTGPHGAIGLRDVARTLEARAATAPRPEASPQALEEERRRRMRRAIAKALTRSKREIPHYYLEHALDLTAALAWLEDANRGRPVGDRILLGAVLLKAVAQALKRFPELNARWEDDTAVPHDGVHLGVAISLRRGGLVAPAIHRADEKTLPELMASLKDLVERARAGKLRGSEMSDATVTVSSLGDRGVDALYGVIYPGQTALVGFGTPSLRPWVVGGGLAARTIITATLSADHRASDGHRGARFLRALQKLLEEPTKLCP